MTQTQRVFSVSFEISNEDYWAWGQRAYKKVCKSESVLAINIIGFFFLGMGLRGLYKVAHLDFVNLFDAIVLIAFFSGAALILLGMWLRSRTVKSNLAKLRSPNFGKIELVVNDDEVVIRTPISETKFERRALIHVEQDKFRVYLLWDEISAIIVPKSALDEAGTALLLSLSDGN